MNFQDSAKLDVLEIKLSLPDSIEEEIITLVAGDSTFFDIEKQTNDKVLKANYRKLKKEELADEIKGRIEKASPPFIVQLLNSKDEIVSELFIEKENTYSFKNVEPGTFKLRVIEDRNGNQRWDPGNYIFNRLAERIFYFKGEEDKTEITVRSGWTLEDQNITSSPTTGFKKED
jgi:hypothetical protein